MAVAAAEPRLLVFSTLNRARREAVEVMNFEVVFFREATLPLFDTHVARFFVVLDIFDRKKASKEGKRI